MQWLLRQHGKKKAQPAPLVEVVEVPSAAPIILAPHATVQSALEYAAADRAPATHRAYQSQWRGWVAWSRQAGIPSLPAPPDGIALYLAHRAQLRKRTTTLAQCLAAIAYHHIQAGELDPTRARSVQTVWAGIKRTHGVAAAKQAAPINPDHLRAMIAALGPGPVAVRDRALLLLGFAGAFRRSELVALEFEDLAFKPEGLLVTLRRSKTDQEGQGRTVAVTPGEHRETCPVAALEDWLLVSGIAAGPIFPPIDKLTGLPMSHALEPREVARILVRRARAAGLDYSRLSAHSLRAGLVTTAIAQGVSDHRVMDQTGHKSHSMVRRYRREHDQLRDGLSKKVGL